MTTKPRTLFAPDSSGRMTPDELAEAMANVPTTDELAAMGITIRKPDTFGNLRATEGCSRCDCGCKYWENDRCVDCGTVHEPRFDGDQPAVVITVTDNASAPLRQAAVRIKDMKPDTTTVTLTTTSLAAAKDALRERFDTEVCAELREPGLWEWAAKRAIAWVRIVSTNNATEFIVEITTAPVYVVVGDNDVPAGTGGAQWVEAVHAREAEANEHAAKLAGDHTEYEVEAVRVRVGQDFADD